MARYIDANSLIEEIHSYTMYDEISKYDIERAIDEAPTVDAEPVIHCKDCACVRAVHMGNKFVYRCPMSTVDVEPEGYCSRGVRRNEDLGRS